MPLGLIDAPFRKKQRDIRGIHIEHLGSGGKTAVGEDGARGGVTHGRPSAKAEPLLFCSRAGPDRHGSDAAESDVADAPMLWPPDGQERAQFNRSDTLVAHA